MSTEQSRETEVPSESPSGATVSPDESAIRIGQLKRSTGIVKLLLGAVKHTKKLLSELAAPFLESPNEQDSQQKRDARKSRQRNAVFAAAKELLAPNHPIKKSFDQALAESAALDAGISSTAQELKSQVLDPLDALIKQAFQHANEELPADARDRFSTEVRELLAEMGRRLEELAKLHKQFSRQLRQARIGRLTTGKNIAFGIALATALLLGAAAYAWKAYVAAKPANSRAPPVAKNDIPPKPALPPAAVAVPEPANVAPAPLASSAASMPAAPTVAPVANADAANSVKSRVTEAPIPKPAEKPSSAAKPVHEPTTLTSGQDPEATKKSLHALEETIKAWNADNDAQAARQKAQQK